MESIRRSRSCITDPDQLGHGCPPSQFPPVSAVHVGEFVDVRVTGVDGRAQSIAPVGIYSNVPSSLGVTVSLSPLRMAFVTG